LTNFQLARKKNESPVGASFAPTGLFCVVFYGKNDNISSCQNNSLDSSMPEYTPYQEKIIKRYYNNRDEIMQQKLSEMITDLYLAEGKKRQKLWQRIVAALKNLGVDAAQIERLEAMDSPAELVKFLEKSKETRM
jgi:hypothetical protein